MIRRFRWLPAVAAILFAALVAAHLISFARYPARCTAALSRHSVLVGDKVTYSVQVTSRSDIEPDIPDMSGALDRFSIIDSGSSREEFMGRSRTARWYLIAQYSPGEYTIAPASVTCRGSGGETIKLESPSVTLTVKSVIGDKERESPVITIEGDLRKTGSEETRSLARREAKTPVMIRILDIRGPINLLTSLDIVLAGAEGALLLFLASWAVSFARKKIAEARRVTPYEAARREARALKAALAKKTISPQESCSRISAMLKRYVKEAFKTGPSEATTTDFLKDLKAIPAASDDVRRALGDALSLCDLVKFSGYEPSAAELEGLCAGASAAIETLHALEPEEKGKAKR